jgi:hypothetical protein
MDRRGIAGLSSRGFSRRDPEFIATFAFVFIRAGSVAGSRLVPAPTGRPGYEPGGMLRLYFWGYLNQVRSSRATAITPS